MYSARVVPNRLAALQSSSDKLSFLKSRAGARSCRKMGYKLNKHVPSFPASVTPGFSMKTEKRFARVGDLDIHYDLADYTDPLRSDEPETFLLYSGYCRTINFWRAWVPLLGR